MSKPNTKQISFGAISKLAGELYNHNWKSFVLINGIYTVILLGLTSYIATIFKIPLYTGSIPLYVLLSCFFIQPYLFITILSAFSFIDKDKSILKNIFSIKIFFQSTLISTFCILVTLLWGFLFMVFPPFLLLFMMIFPVFSLSLQRHLFLLLDRNIDPESMQLRINQLQHSKREPKTKLLFTSIPTICLYTGFRLITASTFAFIAFIYLQDLRLMNYQPPTQFLIVFLFFMYLSYIMLVNIVLYRVLASQFYEDMIPEETIEDWSEGK